MVTKNTWRQPALFVLLCVMVVSLFTSRAALSISCVGFVMLCIFHGNLAKQLFAFLQNPLLVSITLLFFIPFISGLWSEDKQEWMRMMQLKLPLLFFPVAFANTFLLSKKQWKYLAALFLFCVFAGTCFSLFYYLANVTEMNAAYLKAKVLPTPLGNDHIRFSLLVSIAFLLCLYLLEKTHNRKFKRSFIGLAAWLALYLHLLSARTGLICFYIILIGYTLYLLKLRQKQLPAILFMLVILLLPVLSWFSFPTLQNRIRYLQYDLSYAFDNHYLPGANDGARILSLKCGWDILKHHPWGVGMGDVGSEVNKWYALYVPGILPADKLFPSSEWLAYGAIAGWVGVFLFSAIIFYPFFIKKIKDRFYWGLLNVILAFSILFDTGMSVQYGIFIYVFSILMWWKYITDDSAQTNTFLAVP